MAMREATLAGESSEAGDTVDAALKRHEDINRAITLQEEKIDAIKQFADQLATQQHYDSPAIEAKRDDVLQRWLKLKNAMLEQKAKLGEAQSLQSFIRDADEIEIWMNDKLQTALDESYKDPTNVQAKHQKHQAFESELAANSDRVQAVVATGHRLIDSKNCMGQDSAVDQSIRRIAEQWELLVEKSRDKSQKLKDANRQAVYNAGVKARYLHIIRWIFCAIFIKVDSAYRRFSLLQDMEFWLEESENTLQNEDLGKDLSSVQNLLQKHQVLEADVKAHDDRLKDLNKSADEVAEAAPWDAVAIRDRKKLTNQRYEK